MQFSFLGLGGSDKLWINQYSTQHCWCISLLWANTEPMCKYQRGFTLHLKTLDRVEKLFHIPPLKIKIFFLKIEVIYNPTSVVGQIWFRIITLQNQFLKRRSSSRRMYSMSQTTASVYTVQYVHSWRLRAIIIVIAYDDAEPWV